VRPHLITLALLSLTLTIALPASAGGAGQASSSIERAEKLLASGAFDEAAGALEAFARHFPQDPRAPRAFADAAMMNMRLGHLNVFSAESKLSDFENTFVPVNFDLWGEMAFTMIDGFTVRHELENALTLLHRTLTITEAASAEARKKKTADLQTLREIEIRTRGKRARLFSSMGDHRGADTEYARIQKLAAELGVWPGKKPARTTAKYAETIDWIAESFFHIAEQKRHEANRLSLPPYVGKGDRDSVSAFVMGPGEKWYKYREFLVQDAHRLYAFVLGAELPKLEPPKPPPPPSPPGIIGLVGGDPNAPEYPSELDPFSEYYKGASPPSPTWAIAAAERVGSLWSSFVRESRMMPIPKEWSRSPSSRIPGTDLTYAEIKAEYINVLDTPDVVQKQQAKAAYRYCVELSIKQRIINEHTDACLRWLSRNYGAEYRFIDDLAPPGEFFALGHVARPAPLPLFTH
jgi:tetratricopeptide (TPR) repeat protein